jgi:hypothetical protein
LNLERNWFDRTDAIEPVIYGAEMSGQNRFKDSNTSLTGRLNKRFREALLAGFDSAAALATFVRDQLGNDAVHCINWNQATVYAASDLVRFVGKGGNVGKFLGAVQEAQPENKAVTDLLAYLVEAGYLVDTAAPAVATMNPRGADWVAKFPMDRIGMRPEDQVVVISEIAKCFASVAQFERFLIDNFSGEFAALQRNSLDCEKSVRENVEAVFKAFHERRQMIALIMSVQDANQSNMILGLSALQFLPFYRPAEPWIWPWDADGKPVKGSVADPEVKAAKAAAAASSTSPVAAKVGDDLSRTAPGAGVSTAEPIAPSSVATSTSTPAAAASGAKAFCVVRVLTKLNAAQTKTLSDLILACMNHHDLDMVCHIAVGDRLDVVVANGPLRKVVNDLLRYCEEENKLPALLNEILKRRPMRTDIKPAYEKLAVEGVLEIEK